MSLTPAQVRAMRRALHAESEELSDVLVAVVFETVKAINELRDLHGLPRFTKTQVINQIRSTARDLHAEDD